MSKDSFSFRQFTVRQERCAMKVGTDGVLLGAWACKKPAESPMRILDIGTGTGLIALFLAQRFPNATIEAIDIDDDAVTQAKENFAASPFADRLTSRRAYLQDEDEQERYDLVVCNPPFFVDSLTCPDDKRTMARHAKTLTLAELARKANQLLKTDGTLAVIIPSENKTTMESECIFNGMSLQRLCRVKTKMTKPEKRVMIEFGKHTDTIYDEVLIIGDDKYKALTGHFYL